MSRDGGGIPRRALIMVLHSLETCYPLRASRQKEGCMEYERTEQNGFPTGVVLGRRPAQGDEKMMGAPEPEFPIRFW